MFRTYYFFLRHTSLESSFFKKQDRGEVLNVFYPKVSIKIMIVHPSPLEGTLTDVFKSDADAEDGLHSWLGVARWKVGDTTGTVPFEGLPLS